MAALQTSNAPSLVASAQMMQSVFLSLQRLYEGEMRTEHMVGNIFSMSSGAPSSTQLLASATRLYAARYSCTCLHAAARRTRAKGFVVYASPWIRMNS